MAFPSQHVFPGPGWVIQPGEHRLTAGDRVEVSQFDQGEDRHRETRTFTTYRASVSAVLIEAQAYRFIDWHEVDLKAGAELFDTKVVGLNGSTLSEWWQARFVAPYEMEVMPNGLYIVTAELLLLDGPYPLTTDDPAPGTPGRIPPGVMARARGDSAVTIRFDSPGIRIFFDGDSDVTLRIDNGIRMTFDGDSDVTITVINDSYRLLDGAIGSRLIDGDPTSQRLID